MKSDKSTEVVEINDDSSLDDSSCASDAESDEVNSLNKALLSTIQIPRSEEQTTFIKENFRPLKEHEDSAVNELFD